MDSKLEENLHILNRFAGFYKQKERETYNSSEDRIRAEERKEALYKIKEEILRREVDNAEKIELHDIDGNKLYCLYFSNYSFHIPRRSLDIDKDFDIIQMDFEKSTTDKSLSELHSVFNYLEKNHNINANNYLQSEIVNYKGGSVIVKWNY